MLPEESLWIGSELLRLAKENMISPLLNFGSSTGYFREVVQPVIYNNIFKKLKESGIEVYHLDIKKEKGVDFVGNVFEDKNLYDQVKEKKFKVILCSNLLEHVPDSLPFYTILENLVEDKGFVMITVPNRYPYHADPIDTGYRPTVEQVLNSFSNARLIKGETLVINQTHYQYFLKHPKFILITMLRLLTPFYHFPAWKRIVKDMPHFFKKFKVTCVLVQISKQQTESTLKKVVKKKKILYLSNVNLEGPFLPGVILKIKGQENAFIKEGFEVDMLYPGNKNEIIIKRGNNPKLIFEGGREVDIHAPKYKKLIQHWRVSWYGNINFKNCYDRIVNENYDVVYLRFYLPGKDLIKFLENLKKASPVTRVFLEYPTFNIKDLFQFDLTRNFSYRLNKKRIYKLNNIVDYFITLTRHKTLYDKPAIFMPNGIELNGIEPLPVPPFDDKFVLLGVASDINFYHGFDKIIKGLKLVAQNNHGISILFRLISNPFSTNITELKKLATELGVNDMISFELPKTREDLAEVYKEVHMGVGTLALHRVGLSDNYSLKHREYAAFGLPFIMSKGDFHFESSPYVVVEERNDEPVDIQKLVDFYKRLRREHPDYPRDFRKSVENLITWKAQMLDIFKIINEE